MLEAGGDVRECLGLPFWDEKLRPETGSDLSGSPLAVAELRLKPRQIRPSDAGDI